MPWVAIAVGVLAVVSLSGCTGHPSEPTRSPSALPTKPAPTDTATSVPEPTLIADGTATQNKPFFDLVNLRTVRAHPDPVGADFTDGLAAAGFAKKDMQVTADKTSIGLTPGSLQFSVRWKDQCLIGQYGADIGGYFSEITAPLQTGKCLIGQTVPVH